MLVFRLCARCVMILIQIWAIIESLISQISNIDHKYFICNVLVVHYLNLIYIVLRSDLRFRPCMHGFFGSPWPAGRGPGLETKWKKDTVFLFLSKGHLLIHNSLSHRETTALRLALTFKSSPSHWRHNEAFPSRGFSTVTPQTTAGNGIFWKDQNKSRVVNGLSFRQRQCARFQRLEGHNHITMNPLSA